MWLDDKRIKFLDKKNKRKFFKELKQKSGLTYIEIAKESKIPIGRLRLYVNSKRSLPKSLFDLWTQKYAIKNSSYKHVVFDKSKLMTKLAKKGQKKLQQKYGKVWLRNLGKQRMRNMRQEFRDNPELHKKWRQSIKDALVKKYGQGCYRQMGLLGGKRAIEKADKEELRLRLKKAFRKSFKIKIPYDNKIFRSRKEVEVAKLLVTREITYEYEKEVMGFYPDFVLSKRIIIEVVGFDWKPHIERTRKKINIFTNAGFDVLVYTYPNMTKFFDDLDVKISTNIRDLNRTLGYSRG